MTGNTVSTGRDNCTNSTASDFCDSYYDYNSYYCNTCSPEIYEEPVIMCNDFADFVNSFMLPMMYWHDFRRKDVGIKRSSFWLRMMYSDKLIIKHRRKK